MERQKFRVKRVNTPSLGSPVCSGSTNLWPVNLSSPIYGTNSCQNIQMYTSPGMQIYNALNGDMTTFPNELKDCSFTDPCLIVWDAPTPSFTSPTVNYCKDVPGDVWVKFGGITYFDTGGNATPGSYEEIMALYDINNLDPTKPILSQFGGYFSAVLTPCFCDDPFSGQNLNKLTISLTQDFNDMGHYSVWDGNMGQKEIFSNFLITAMTSYNIQVFNTTDFAYYKNLQTNLYTVDWGDGTALQSFPINGTLTATHLYPAIATSYIVTINLPTPFGPLSTSKLISVPNFTFQNMLGQPYSPSNMLNTGGLQPAQNITTLTGPPIYDNDPLSATFGQIIGNMGSSSAYHGVYSQVGTLDYLPLDSGISILEYTGLSVTPCFDVTGITESSLGLFQTYSSAPSNSPFLPNGYFLYTNLVPYIVPLGGDVFDVDGIMGSSLEGYIFEANTNFTGYTIQSGANVPYNTPIDFYTFSNGITIFVAQSCGLNAPSFGGEKCYQCVIEDCLYCEEKDEYIDRGTIPTTPTLIAFVPGTNTNYAALGEPWSPNEDYIIGDIIFDTTNQLCCCYMAVKDIHQINSATPDLWSGIPPAFTDNGVWTNPNPTIQPPQKVHIWEACCYFPECECSTCPIGTMIPCNDPTLALAGIYEGVYTVGNTYTLGYFVSDTWGNCYKALQGGVLGAPTGVTGQWEWEYTGCISWICPPDPYNPNTTYGGCEPYSGSSVVITNSIFPPPGTLFIGSPTYQGCIDDFTAVPTECPYPDRWVCDDRFDCGLCIPILPGTTSPSGIPYNHPLYPNQFVFSSETDCNLWCNPEIYSCSTIFLPCCTTYSCGLNAMIYQALTAGIPDGMDPLTILTTFGLYVNGIQTPPFYTLNDCQQTCCEDTYGWDCEFGCIITSGSLTPVNASSINALVPNSVPQTLNYCQLLNGGVTGPQGIAAGINQVPSVACAWSCVTPYQVYNPVPPDPYGIGVYLSPCQPCYTNNCAPFSSETICVTACSESMDCWVCDCGGTVSCYPESPCVSTTISPTSPILGPNNGIATTSPTNPNPLMSFATATACTGSCICDSGWDCWIIDDPFDPNNGLPDGEGCTEYPNSAMVPPNLTASTGGPYTSFTACCIATNCCEAICDEVAALLTPYSNQSQPFGWHPCVYEWTPLYHVNCALTVAQYQLGMNYCSIQDCYANENPMNAPAGEVQCSDIPPGCPCCSAYTWTQYGFVVPLIDRGIWDSLATGYQPFDTVIWDPNNIVTPECCWICICPNNGGTQIPGMFDCDAFTPDGMPDPGSGQVNCWERCDYEPSHIGPIITYSGPVVTNVTPGNDCRDCDPMYSADTWTCTYDGCVDSSTVPGGPCAIAVGPSQTQQNCYDNANCDTNTGWGNECKAGCYCEEGPAGSPPQPFSQSGCVVLQDWLNQNDLVYIGGYPSFPPTVHPAGYPTNPPAYPWPNLNLCIFVIVTNLNVDCCDDPRYYCDNGANCPPGGTGCQPIYPGDPNYISAPFSSLGSCEAYCTWECDASWGGWNNCIFVPNSMAAITYSSAIHCWWNTAYTCKCQDPFTMEWVCDTTLGVGTTAGSSNCVPFATGGAPPNPLTSWGIIPATFQPCVYGAPGCFTFGSQSLCEGYCRFCCDVSPPGTGICQLDWAGNACDVSIYDCWQTTFGLYAQYSCIVNNWAWCCHPINGCTSYNTAGPQPAGCNGIIYGSLGACTSQCHFICDDCVNSCTCIHVAGNLPGPCNPALSYSSMTECDIQIQLNSGNIIGWDPDYPSCCDCMNCLPTVSYLYLSAPNTFSPTTQAVFSVPPSAPLWIQGTTYIPGDVVHTHDGVNTDDYCCFVKVAPWVAYNVNKNPFTYYQDYLTDVANNVQTWGGSAQWIPCDIDCADVTPVITWDCTPGVLIDTCGSMKQSKGSDGFCTCFCEPNSPCGPGRCTARYPHEAVWTFADPDNNAGNNCGGSGGGPCKGYYKAISML